MKIAVLFLRLGPYHFARLKAVHKLCRLHAIELSGVDRTYAWDTITDHVSFKRTTVFSDRDIFNVSTGTIRKELRKIFAGDPPDVVAIPGWSGKYVFAALAVCIEMQLPTIVLSESTEHDVKRVWWKELVKKKMIENYSAALVGGKPHAGYLQKLGMHADRIFYGYDVVDNEYFFSLSTKAKNESRALRAQFALPEKYFLSSNRFVPKKNISTIIQAYYRYRIQVGANSWKLVLLGDGELRQELEAKVRELQLQDSVFFPGFKQYPDLPVYYGLAKAYIQASTTEQWGLVVNEAMASGLPVLVSERCGCAPDLVEEGLNGYTFNPFDVAGLAGLMRTMTENEGNLAELGRESLRIIANWTPEVFGRNLFKAAQFATQLPSPAGSWVNRVIITRLCR